MNRPALSTTEGDECCTKANLKYKFEIYANGFERLKSVPKK